MALKLPVRKPVAVAAPAPKIVTPAKGASTTLVPKKEIPPPEEKSSVTATVRLTASLNDMCKEMQIIYEDDRSEILKKAIRLLYGASTAKDSTLTLTLADGSKNTVVVMKNGKAML